ncbi:MAG TPA: YihY/virulence factor BrkB family protein [Sphingobacteriaceae bacterium]
MNISKSLKSVWKLIAASFTAFMDDKALKLSAALAYFSIFSLAPLLMIIIFAMGSLYGSGDFSEKVFNEMNSLLGREAATQIQETVKKISLAEKSNFALITGIVTLFLGATGVFVEIQDSINMIWKVKAKPKKGFMAMIKNRFLSFSLIISLGFLMIVSLIINGLVVALMDQLMRFFPDIAVIFLNIANLAVTFIIITILFGIIFKFLPDVKIPWKTVRKGALFTAVLFMVGRYLIGLYISLSDPGTAFGAGGSLIVVLVWVFYTAAILYFGAEFTQVYAEATGCRIEPASYAVHIVTQEEEKDVKVLPDQGHDVDKSDT